MLVCHTRRVITLHFVYMWLWSDIFCCCSTF